MKQLNKLWIAGVAFIFLFASCNKSNPIGERIPVNASAVMQVNLKSMGEKLSWKEFKEAGWLQKVDSHPSTPDWFRNIFEQPEKSGIDFEKGLTLFADKSLSASEHLVVNGFIQNEKDFKTFVQHLDSTQTAKTVGKINMLLLKNHDVIGWTDKQFSLVLGNAINSMKIDLGRDSTDSIIIKPIESDDDKLEFCSKLFSLKKDSSLAKNEKFSSLLNNKGDVHIWMNPIEDLKKSSSFGMLSMMKLEKLFSESFSAFTVNFEKGNIDIQQQQYLSKDLINFLKKYSGSNINTEMIEYLPSQNVVGVLAANFKPEALQELIKLLGLDGLANMYLQTVGISLDDFSKANNGNLMMAVTDFKVTDSAFLSTPGMNSLMAIGIRDAKSFDKIYKSAQQILSNELSDSSLYVTMNDQYFVVGNNANFSNQYLKKNTQKFEFINEFKDHSFGLFINLQNFLKTAIAEPSIDSLNKKNITLNLQMWKELIVKGGEVKDGALNFKGNIYLMNKQENSLRQLNKFMNEMYALNRTRIDNYNKERILDSVLTPPPIDTVRPISSPKE